MWTELHKCFCVSGTWSVTPPNPPPTLCVDGCVGHGRPIHMGRGVGAMLITDPTLYTGQISRTGQDKETLPATAKSSQIF